MFLLIAKRRICSTIYIPLFNSPRQIHRFFSSESAPQNPFLKTPKFAVVDYLISNFGFSLDKAARVSKRIAHLKSPEKPDSVRRLLNDKGFSESDVKRLITWFPDLLCSSPEKTLAPNIRALYDMGLSTAAINQIILSNPNALLLHSAMPRITFWMDFLGGNESTVVKAFTRNRGLVGHDINSNIAPKISLLQRHGFSNLEIRRMVCMVPKFITGRISGMEDLLNRVKELGFQPRSGMFLGGLQAMVAVSREALKKRMDLLMSFGWSEDDFFSAVRNAPLMVALKEENMRTKMDFLLGEARCDLSHISSHPLLLNFSLERRLRPRNNVLHLLETKGLCQKQRVLYTAISMSNSDFVKKYILPHKEILPELQEAFTVACTSGSRSTFSKLK